MKAFFYSALTQGITAFKGKLIIFISFTSIKFQITIRILIFFLITNSIFTPFIKNTILSEENCKYIFFKQFTKVKEPLSTDSSQKHECKKEVIRSRLNDLRKFKCIQLLQNICANHRF